MTDKDKRALRQIESRIDSAKASQERALQAWARLVDRLGPAVVASELGVSVQAVSARAKRIRERKRGGP